jgi:esterase/lipase
MNSTEKILGDIRIPTLIVQGSNDPVVNPISGKEVFEKIGSEIKELRTIPAKKHVIVRGEERKIVFEAVATFLDKYL